jgi:hypothetical protein
MYFGQSLSDYSLGLLRETGRETFDMYSARLAHDCSTVRPEWYFQRKQVPRLDSEIHEYAVELWGNSQELLHARAVNRHSRNHKACMYKNSPCRYLGICSKMDSPDSDNWKRKPQVHNELPMIDGDGRDILTNSRMGEFMLCRRKHYFAYELGIERAKEEESAALFFGNVWHAGQEAWWNAMRKERA